MNINIIASSSEGNCTHIYTKNTNILIDVGIPAKRVIEATGVEYFDAIFISHEHLDHIRGLGPLGRRTGSKMYLHPLVYEKISNNLNNCDVIPWLPGEVETVGDFTVKNFSTRHDSVYSYGFVVSDGNKKVGYLTDSGSWTKLMGNYLKDCDGYIIEADYDYDSLMAFEDYDDLLKERISSNWGHLSNDQAMTLLRYLTKEKEPEFVVFAHLSPRTNSPEMVKMAAKEAFPSWDDSIFKIAPTEIKTLNQENL